MGGGRNGGLTGVLGFERLRRGGRSRWNRRLWFCRQLGRRRDWRICLAFWWCYVVLGLNFWSSRLNARCIEQKRFRGTVGGHGDRERCGQFWRPFSFLSELFLCRVACIVGHDAGTAWRGLPRIAGAFGLILEFANKIRDALARTLVWQRPGLLWVWKKSGRRETYISHYTNDGGTGRNNSYTPNSATPPCNHSTTTCFSICPLLPPQKCLPFSISATLSPVLPFLSFSTHPL